MLIGFFGCPGSGKSTAAFQLCYELKKRGYPVEFYQESARELIAKANTPMDKNLQYEVFKQDAEDANFWKSKRNRIVVTDGGSFNAFFYGTDCDFVEELNRYDLIFFCEGSRILPVDPGRIHDQEQVNQIAYMMTEEYEKALADERRKAIVHLWVDPLLCVDNVEYILKMKGGLV